MLTARLKLLKCDMHISEILNSIQSLLGNFDVDEQMKYIQFSADMYITQYDILTVLHILPDMESHMALTKLRQSI